MVPRALHHCGGARQTHGETLAGDATEKCLAAGGTIQHSVAHDGVDHCLTAKVDAGSHHHTPTGESFAGVVVGVAYQVQRDAFGQKRTKGLTASAFQLNAQGVVGQAFGAHLGEGPRQHRAHRTVDVARDFHELHFFAFVDGGTAFLDQHFVQRFVQTVVLGAGVEQGRACGHFWARQQAGEIQATGLPVLYTLFHVQQI